MAEEEKKKSGKVNDVSNSKNWESRVLSEMEAPHLWNKTWSPLFESDVSVLLVIINLKAL